MLSLVIGADGKVSGVETQQGVEPCHDEQAVKAVLQRTYVPATYQGRPVAVMARLRFEFTGDGWHAPSPWPVASAGPGAAVQKEMIDDVRSWNLRTVLRATVTVTRQGTLRDIVLDSGAPKGEEKSILRALERWRLSPAKIEGEAIDCRSSLSVAYHDRPPTITVGVEATADCKAVR